MEDGLMPRGKGNAEIELLLKIIDQSYDHIAWHGTNLRGSLRGLTLEEASWCPAPGRHNIWENMVHTAYWKYAVRRCLLGEKRGSFELKGSNWFVRPQRLTDEAWRADIGLLESTHSSLRQAVQELSPARLHQAPAGRKVTNAAMIYGIASHDVYHAGQIQLLKRLLRTR
jgi:uncharacterized damage-inducible protein DinB